MNDKHLALGLVAASTLAILTTVSISVRAEPSCYMQTRDGKLVDLSRLCGKKASPSSAISQASGADDSAAATGNPRMTSTQSNSNNIGRNIGKIDPNAPATNRLVLRDKPSEIWNSLPDLPSAPTKGAASQ